MSETLENKEWTEWKSFPDPRNKEYLYAPFGFGVYQLRNKITNKYVLFGSGNNCAIRMTSLLPEPFGAGTRKNVDKRNYVLENLKDIEYRTIAFSDEASMKQFEQKLKECYCHLYNT